MSLTEPVLFSMLMESRGISNPDQEIPDARTRKDLMGKLVELAGIAEKVTSKRERVAAQAALEEYKNNLKLVELRSKLVVDLEKLDKRLGAERRKEAMRLAQAAASYENRTLRKLQPDRERVEQTIVGAADDADLISQLVSNPIIDSATGMRASDEQFYARLKYAGDRTGLFKVVDGKVIIQERLKPLERAGSGLIRRLKNAAKASYPAYRALEASAQESGKVQAELIAVAENPELDFDPAKVSGAIQSLQTAQQVSPNEEQIAKRMKKQRELLEADDKVLAKIDRVEKEVRAELGRSTQDDSLTAKFARAVNNPYFREWAESNGLDIGTSDGTASSYVEGRDDLRAVLLYARQKKTGLRFTKREGRMVRLPQEFVESTPLDTVSDEQRALQAQARDKLTELQDNTEAVLRFGDNYVFEGKDGKAYALGPDGMVEPVEEDGQSVVAAMFSSLRDGTMPADDQLQYAITSPQERAAYGVAVSKMAETLPKKERQASGENIFIELRQTAAENDRGVKKLKNTETGEIIEVPSETVLEVVKDIRVPLGERIAARADKRYAEREKRKADERRGIRYEPDREEQPEDYEDEPLVESFGAEPLDRAALAEEAKLERQKRRLSRRPQNEETRRRLDEVEKRLDALKAVGRLASGGTDVELEEDLGETVGTPIPKERRKQIELQKVAQSRAARAQAEAEAETAERREKQTLSPSERKAALDLPTVPAELAEKTPFLTPMGQLGRPIGSVVTFPDSRDGTEYTYDIRTKTFRFQRSPTSKPVEVTAESNPKAFAALNDMMTKQAPALRQLAEQMAPKPEVEKPRVPARPPAPPAPAPAPAPEPEMSPLQRLRSIRDQRRQRRIAKKAVKRQAPAAAALEAAPVPEAPSPTSDQPSPRQRAFEDVEALRRQRKKQKALDDAKKAAQGGE